MSVNTSSWSFRLLKGAGLGVALTAVWLGMPSKAAACGGLFCSNANPVNQAAERIIFSDNGDGTVTTLVEILYEGPTEEFSWVLPVVGEPEVGISSTVALDRLQQASNPVYQLQTQFADGCAVPAMNFSGGAGADAGASADGGAVRVIAAGTVGPFDYEVIQVADGLTDPADVAVDWLETNGYDVGPLGRERLRPYLESKMNLLGFRLTKDASSGSIRPVTVTYPAERPMIPIRPTAVAANDDMGVLVWVLGDARAVPTNYRSLELNETLIDWFNPSSNYNDVVIAAANEAGGHGFVTEQSGPAGEFNETIWTPAEQRAWERISTGLEGGIPEQLEDITSWFGDHDGYVDAVRANVPLRSGVTPEEFIECVWCYYNDGAPAVDGGLSSSNDAGAADSGAGTADSGASDPSLATDMTAFLADVEELVIQPVVATAALFEKSQQVTRLYTTLSADEMTVDPEFDFNPELEDVSNIHTATRTLTCDGNDEWEARLPDGFVVQGVEPSWPVAMDALPANRRVLQLSTSGEGEVIEDNTMLIAEQFPMLPATDGGISGGGNQSGGRNTSGANGGAASSNGSGASSGTAEDGGVTGAMGMMREGVGSSGGGGCGCRTASHVPGSAAHLSGLLLAAAAWAGRRRRRA